MMIGSAALVLDKAHEPAVPARSVETITFRDGLLGFADCRAFTLLATERESLFWLQSLEHEPLAFLLLDPFTFFEDFTVDLDPADARALGAVNASDIAVLAIVTLPTAEGEPCTANLVGPLAINLRNGQARQLILRNPAYGVRCPVDLKG